MESAGGIQGDATERIESSEGSGEDDDYLPQLLDDKSEASDEEIEEFLIEDLDLHDISDDELSRADPRPTCSVSVVRLTSAAHQPSSSTIIAPAHPSTTSAVPTPAGLATQPPCPVTSTPNGSPEVQVLLHSPKDVTQEPSARLHFLQELADDVKYVALLECVSPKVVSSYNLRSAWS